MKKQAFNSMSSTTLDAHQKVDGKKREQSGGETTPISSATYLVSTCCPTKQTNMKNM